MSSPGEKVRGWRLALVGVAFIILLLQRLYSHSCHLHNAAQLPVLTPSPPLCLHPSSFSFTPSICVGVYERVKSTGLTTNSCTLIQMSNQHLSSGQTLNRS